MINERVILKLPLDFKNKFKIYPPSINEVLTTTFFPEFRRLFTISQEELEDEWRREMELNGTEFDASMVPTPFEYLIGNCLNIENFTTLACKAFEFFIHEKVLILPDRKIIIIGDLKEKVKEIKSVEELTYLREEEYFDFQNEIRIALGEKSVRPPNPNEDPRVKKIKAKARYRDYIKAKKGLGITLGTSIASICCMGLGLTPLNIGEMSYAAISYLMDTYQEKEKYQVDIDSILAGADSKKIKPKYWIRNLEN